MIATVTYLRASRIFVEAGKREIDVLKKLSAPLERASELSAAVTEILEKSAIMQATARIGSAVRQKGNKAFALMSSMQT